MGGPPHSCLKRDPPFMFARQPLLSHSRGGQALGQSAGLHQAQRGLRANPSTKSRGAHVFVSARELSSPSRSASGLASLLKYKLRGPVWTSRHPSQSTWPLSWAKIPSSCGWVFVALQH